MRAWLLVAVEQFGRDLALRARTLTTLPKADAHRRRRELVAQLDRVLEALIDEANPPGPGEPR